MANMIPSCIYACENANSGEIKVFNLLKNGLPDNYTVWYEHSVDEQKPDFLILGPDLGILAIEVKSWSLGSIIEVKNDMFTIKGKDKIYNDINPLIKAESFIGGVSRVLQTYPNLVNQDGKYKGRVKFPHKAGVIFPNLSLKAYNSTPKLNKSIKNHEKQVIFKELFDSICKDKNLLMSTLKNMNRPKFDMYAKNFNPLSDIEIREIEEIILPTYNALESKNIVTIVEDMQRDEVLNMNYGHQVVIGVAGSGKTHIIVERAKLLMSRHPDFKIAIICFNKSIVAYIRSIIIPINNNIDIYYYHQFKYIKDRKEYDAILVDEGQDLEPVWISKILDRLKNRDKSHFLITLDGGQNIYNRIYDLIDDVGLKLNDEPIILDFNYRNSKQIAEFAYEFLYKSNSDKSNSFTDSNFIINMSSAIRTGDSIPIIQKIRSIEQQAIYICNEISSLVNEGIPLSQISIISAHPNIDEYILNELNNYNIEYYHISRNDNNKVNLNINSNSVKVSTLHSIKGLDFNTVFLFGVDNIKPSNSYNSNKIVYTAMTRATDKLYITYSDETDITKLIESTYITCFGNFNIIECKKCGNEELKDKYCKICGGKL